MSTEIIYNKDTKVWIPDAEYVWHPARILEDFDVNRMQLVVQLEDSGELKTLIIKSNNEMPAVFQEDLLDDESNLNLLSNIHEASVLNTLRTRFQKRVIYNYCDLAMIVLNPFAKSPIDVNDQINKYRGQMIDKVEPHIFAYAEKAYCRLERENRDQSMVFTGESGTGKTTSAECAILYLVNTSTMENLIKKKILASSTVLQAFGNAKTMKNDNSSRFGKFLQLQYDQDYRIIGASVKTYLLDKSRVVNQMEHEKNFNIFYQLRSTKNYISSLQKGKLEFSYLNEKGSLKDDYMENSKLFNNMLSALEILDFSKKQQDDIIQILVAILHLGNLNFISSKDVSANFSKESCFITNLNHLQILVQLFDLEEKATKSLRKWMRFKRISFQQDEFMQPMTVNQAINARNALAKFIYAKLFNWLVVQINASFRSPCHVQSFIGILDLFGFENKESNYFEQFCINYAEEKIQQIFLQTFFKAKQEEYMKEELEWSLIEVQDNEACVKLIEGKLGIIDILDEETKKNSNISRSDERIYEKWEKTKHFEKSVGNNLDFSICHFINRVEYSVDDFIEKNRDNMIIEQLEVLKDTKIELLNKLIIDELSKLAVGKKKRKTTHKRLSLNVIKSTKKTLIADYRNFVMNLTSLINTTTPHYVRCIKTNNQQESFKFDSNCVAEQLRAYNVVETIRISAVGFANHLKYMNFIHRYHCLLRFELIKRDDSKETCRKILTSYIEVVSPSKCEMNSLRNMNMSKRGYNQVMYGKTEIFLRDEVIQLLERLRSEKRHRACIVIQKSIRSYLMKIRFEKVRRAVSCLQRNVRLYLARKRLPKERAAIKIQKIVRGYLARRKFKKTISDVVIIQACARRFLAKIRNTRLRKQEEENRQWMAQELRNRVDVMKQKINVTMEKHSASGQLQAMSSIISDLLCVQSKNKILSQMFLEKIQTLKELSTSNAKTCEPPEVESDRRNFNDLEGHNLCTVFKKLIHEEDDCKSLKSLFYSLYQFEKRTETLKEYLGLDELEIELLKAVIKDSDRAELSHQNEQEEKKDEEKDEQYEDNNETVKEYKQEEKTKEIKHKDKDENEKEEKLEEEDANKKEDKNAEEKEEDTQLSENRNYEEHYFDGMLCIKNTEVNLFISRLLGQDPYVIIEQSPYLPAQILMMCIRYADILKDRTTAFTIIYRYSRAVREVVKLRDDLDTTFLWMNTTHWLINYLKQFARDDNDERNEFSEVITDRQRMQRLRYIDLDSKWMVLGQDSQWMVKKALEQMSQRSIEFMVPGIVENEELKGDENVSELRRSGCEIKPKGEQLVKLLSAFSSFDDAMKRCKLEKRVALQLFKKLFSFMNSITLGTIMSRKEFCTTMKGIQIRYNLLLLQQWARNRGLLEVTEPLSEVIQVARFIQMQPIDASDIDTICNHFDLLNYNQIKKLVEFYDPNEDECEIYQTAANRLLFEFQNREQWDKTASVSSNFDVEEYPVTFLFHYSPVRFEDVEIPAVFNLSMFTKI